MSTIPPPPSSMPPGYQPYLAAPQHEFASWGSRVVGHWIDGICYIGYLSPLWDKNKQTFADKIFGTYSIRA